MSPNTEPTLPESPRATPRSGTVTGARIVLLVEHGGLEQNSAGILASTLGMEESYVRRVCRTLASQGILKVGEVKQRGTPPVKVYSIVKPKKK